MSRLTKVFERQPEAADIGLEWATKMYARELPDDESNLASLDRMCEAVGITDADEIADIAVEGIQAAMKLRFQE
jgi:hypothetical protein